MAFCDNLETSGSKFALIACETFVDSQLWVLRRAVFEGRNIFWGFVVEVYPPAAVLNLFSDL